MAPINPPTNLQAGSYSARLDRLQTAALLAPLHGTGALAIRSGVRPTPSNTGLQVTQRSTPAMFVTVAAGTGYVQTASNTGGCYVVHNDAAHDVAIASAHATLGRRDLVVARVYDAEVSGVLNEWRLEAITGTPSGSPVAPSAPAGSIPLAVVLVPAASSTVVNGNITDARVYTTALGGTVPAPSASLPANPYPGMAAYDLTNSRPAWYSGSAWRSWADEGFVTAAYLSGNGYLSASAMNTAGYWPTQVAVKTADQSRSNSTSLVADNHLSLSVVANATYWLEGLIIYDGADTGDILFGWTGPSGAELHWCSDLLGVSEGAGGSGVGTVGRTYQTLTNTPSGGCRGAGQGLVGPVRGCLVTSASAGTFGFRFAQASAVATATYVRTGSMISLRRLI